jgi:hypothetical protein
MSDRTGRDRPTPIPRPLRNQPAATEPATVEACAKDYRPGIHVGDHPAHLWQPSESGGE